MVADLLSRSPVELPGSPEDPQTLHTSLPLTVATLTPAVHQREYVPLVFRPSVLEQFHYQLGHPAADPVLTELRKFYHWEGMAKDTEAFVQSCRARQHSTGRPEPLAWNDTSETTHPWQKVSLDTMGLGDWDMTLRTCLDQFSKYLQVRVVKNKDAQLVIDAYMDMLFLQAGRPDEVLLDNGTEFTWLEEFSKRTGFKWWTTSVRHPQSNGMVERVHRTLLDRCHKLLVDHPTMTRENVIKQAVFQYNNTRHHSTGESPNFIQFGRSVVPVRRTLSQTTKARVKRPRFTGLLRTAPRPWGSYMTRWLSTLAKPESGGPNSLQGGRSIPWERK